MPRITRRLLRKVCPPFCSSLRGWAALTAVPKLKEHASTNSGAIVHKLYAPVAPHFRIHALDVGITVYAEEFEHCDRESSVKGLLR